MSEQVHVNKQDITNIANAIRTQKNEPASMKYKVNEMDEAIGTLVSPTGTINITENGTVDVTNYASANVNVSSDIVIYNCRSLFAQNYRIDELNKILPLCKPTLAVGMFSGSSNLKSIPLFDTSLCTDMSSMFGGCSSLIEIPALDTSNVQKMSSAFNYCSSLEYIPILNMKNLSSYNSLDTTFRDCPKLSNEGLNNILASIVQSSISSYYKTLSRIGLTQTQAETCTTLSNWQACVNAGWSTGY